MYEYSQIPKRTNNVATATAAMFFIFALILLAFPAIFELPFKGIYQALAVCFFALSVMILTRYLLKGFIYATREVSEGYDLTVTETKGNSSVTVCRISLSNIEDVVVLERNEKQKRKELKKRAIKEGRKTFSYFPDMLPPKECLVFVTECGEPYLLRLAADDTLIAILTNAKISNVNGEKTDDGN